MADHGSRAASKRTRIRPASRQSAYTPSAPTQGTMCALPLAEDPFRCHKDYLPCTLYLSRVGVHALCNVLSISKILGVSRTSSAFCGRVRRRAHREFLASFLHAMKTLAKTGERDAQPRGGWLIHSEKKKRPKATHVAAHAAPAHETHAAWLVKAN